MHGKTCGTDILGRASMRSSVRAAENPGLSKPGPRISTVMRSIVLIVLSATLSAYGHSPEAQLPFANPHAHEQIEGHAHTGWDSRYFSEGRDNLNGDSLWAGSIEIGWKGLAGGAWYGRSPDQDYDELQLSLAFTGHAGDLAFHAGYTHLRFPLDGAHDHEIGAGIEWTGLPLQLALTADAYYSFDAGGCFTEMSVTREFEITDRLSLDLSSVFGLNSGYVSDGHDGANHLALRLAARHAITDSVSVVAHTAYSWALGKDADAPGDDTLVDFFHGGIGLEWTF